jgi:hypothetical protein
VAEEFLIVGGQQVMATIEPVVLRRAFVHVEQIGGGRRVKPMPVRPPFQTRRELPVDDEDAQTFSQSVLSMIERQARAEKIVGV